MIELITNYAKYINSIKDTNEYNQGFNMGMLSTTIGVIIGMIIVRILFAVF